MIVGWDDFTLDVPGRRLTGPEGDIHLEPQVFDVLALLVANRERVIPKAEILDEVWGDQYVSESALSTRIKQARKSLGDDGRTQRYIRNVHGRGYQFVGQASVAEQTAGPETGPGTTQDQHQRTPTAAPVDLAREIAVDDDFPFVGRLDELDQAQVALQANGSTEIFIAGPPGVGKSRLAVELLRRSGADGALVAAGRCEQDFTSGLQAVRDVFTQIAAGDTDRVTKWAAGIEGQLLSLIPSLANQLDQTAVPVDVYAGIDVFLTALERLAADGPMVMLIDDFQWSDEPTRLLLDRVGRRLGRCPIHVVATYRSGRNDLPDEVRNWIRSRSGRPSAVSLELGNLDEEPARQLIQAALDDASKSDVDDLLDLTEANCLFLTETLRDLPRGRGTARSVAELIAARVDHQDDEVQAVVTAGAALGPEFPFSVAAAVAGLDGSQALAAIDRALSAELLHETASASRFRFSHQLVPESILAAKTRAERANLHHRCGQALSDHGAPDTEVVMHRLRAVPLVSIEQAMSEARAAAASARESKQFDLARRILSQALEAEPPARDRAEIRLELAQILNELGTPAAAIEMLDELANASRRNGWSDLVVEVALARWSQSPFRRTSETGTMELLAEAAEILGPAESVQRARVLAKTAAFSVFTLRLAERGRLADEAVVMARACEAESAVMVEVLEGAAIANTCPAGADRLDELNPEIARLRTAIGADYFRDASAPETLAMMRARGEEFRRVTQADPDRVAAQPIAEWRDLVLSATRSAFAGDIEEAGRRYDRAGEIGDQYWGESSAPLHAYAHFFLDLVTGHWTRCRELMELLMAFAPEAVFFAPAALAVHHQGGREGEVEELAAQVTGRQLSSYSEHIIGGNALVATGELALALDDDRLAELTEEALTPLGDLMLGLPWSPALAAADVLCRLARRRGDETAAAAHQATAVSIYEELDAPILVARLAGEAG